MLKFRVHFLTMNIDIDSYRCRIGCFVRINKCNKLKCFKEKYCSIPIISEIWLFLKILINIILLFIYACNLFLAFACFLFCYMLFITFPEISQSVVNYSYLLRYNHAGVKKFAFISIILALIEIDFQLLLLSGDIEANPGPKANKLNFAVWNVDSLLCESSPRIPQIESLDAIKKFDIFGICETYLNDSVDPDYLNIHGFTNPPFRADCQSANEHKKGGVCLYYKDYVPIKNRPELTTLEETLVCEIKLKNKKVFFILSYRTPSQHLVTDIDTYCAKLETTMNNVSNENPSMIILSGDFNAKSRSFWEDEPTENIAGKKLAKFMLDNQLEELIKEATHFRNSPTCIDLIFTNQPNYFVDFGTLPSQIPTCHHNIIHGTLNYSVPTPPPYQRKLWQYDKADITLIRNELKAVDWTEKFRDKNVNQMTETLNSIILSTADKYIPHKTVTINDKDAPWISNTIKNKIKRKHKIFKKWRETNNDDDKIKYKRLQSDVHKITKEAKKTYIGQMSQKLTKPENEHVFWTAFNRLTNNKKITNIPPLDENGKMISNFQEKASLFNKYFATQCTPLNYEVALPPLIYKTEARLNNIEISTSQIISLINKLNTKKSNGPDEISSHMLKLCAIEIAIPIKIIYQKSLNDMVFPDLWKRANVQPVHKKDSRQIKTNYRPISLLPILSKIFEKLLFDNTYKFLITNSLLSENQSGFRPQDSTINQLLSITNEIYENFEQYAETRALFLDISKAFDKVWHKGLLFKLKCNGIDGKLLNFYANFLTNRQQRVVLNGQTSEWEKLYSGVPQGSVLGPLFFLIYINDLTENINSQMKLFADDSSLFAKVTDIHTTQENLESDLNTISNWAHQWKMQFNPDITKQAIEVIFSWKKNKPIHPPILFNNIAVSRETSTKHLGIILDDHLTFKRHVEEKIKKANKGLGLLKYLKKFSNRIVLNKIYKMFIRPHLDYGDVIYHGQSNETSDMIESVQYRAGLIVTGCWKGTSRIKLYNELGWESLYQRRHFRRLCLYFKIMNGLTPDYLYRCITDIPTNCTNRYYMSFFPYCKAYWDNLDCSVKNSTSLSVFKTKLLRIIRPTESVIPICNDNKTLSALTRIRVGHSDLRGDRFRHNFNCSSPLCSCDTGDETAEHFFLKCPKYTTPRMSLFLKLLEITEWTILYEPDNVWTCVLLFGDSRLTKEKNCEILTASITFLRSTKRFNKIEAYIEPL